MKTKELRTLSTEELEEKLETLNKNIFEMSAQRRYGKVEKPHLFKETKKTVARILTILREKKNEK